MKRVLCLVLLSIALSAGAQYQWDYGVKLGASNYLGDIGGKNLERRDYFVDMHLGQTKYAAGIYGRYKFSKRFAVSANLDHILIGDADEHTTYAPRRARNMNFRNRMFELGVRAELTIWYDNDVGNRGFYNPDYKLYAFAGIAGYYSNPQAKLVYDADTWNGKDTSFTEDPGGLVEGDYVDNKWHSLRKLRTEGATYSAFGLGVPLGIGMYFTFNKEWRIGWEVCWRYTLSDYLDDVSTYYELPNPENPDDMGLAMDLQSQTYQGLVDEQNTSLDLPQGQVGMSLNDFRYQTPPVKDPDGTWHQSPRGIHDPSDSKIRKDSYITTQFTIGKVIRGRSKFYKSKYSWVKNRATVRRSRAKF